MTDQIFVSIPTMNDSEYLGTIERMLSAAEHPGRIHVGTTIFWKPEDLPIYGAPFFYEILKEVERKYSANVSIDVLPWSRYPGVGHGRIEPLKHYKDEKYFLSLDSHMAFVKNWDSILIDRYENAKKHFGKMLLLTTYLPAYFPEHTDPNYELLPILTKDSPLDVDRSQGLYYLEEDTLSRWQFFDYNHQIPRKHISCNYIFPFPNDKTLAKDSPILEHLIDDQYLPAKKISAHFNFTEARPWVTSHRINLHQQCHFWSEEFYQSSLAYARGYNLVWIKDPLFFHLYNADCIKRSDQTNYENNDSARRRDGVIEWETFSDKIELYNNHISQISGEVVSPVPENEVVKSLITHNDYFGYLPRSTTAFCRYSKVDLGRRHCGPWWEVPRVDVIFK